MWAQVVVAYFTAFFQQFLEENLKNDEKLLSR
jgi:hypothetical protein